MEKLLVAFALLLASTLVFPLARKFDALAAEFHRRYDENIKAEIWAVNAQMAGLRKAGNQAH